MRPDVVVPLPVPADVVAVGRPLGGTVLADVVLRPTVVDQDRRTGGDDVVGVHLGDGEVAHVVAAEPGAYRHDGLGTAVEGAQPGAGREVGRLGPQPGRGVPERVVPRRVDGDRGAGTGAYCHVGQVGVVVVVQQFDPACAVLAGDRIGRLDLVAHLDVLDGLGGPVGHEYRRVRVEAVAAPAGRGASGRGAFAATAALGPAAAPAQESPAGAQHVAGAPAEGAHHGADGHVLHDVAETVVLLIDQVGDERPDRTGHGAAGDRAHAGPADRRAAQGAGREPGHEADDRGVVLRPVPALLGVAGQAPAAVLLHRFRRWRSRWVAAAGAAVVVAGAAGAERDTFLAAGHHDRLAGGADPIDQRGAVRGQLLDVVAFAVAPELRNELAEVGVEQEQVRTFGAQDAH